MATYQLAYLGKHAATNLDAVACGLRLTREGDYVQYFMPLVSGPSLAGGPPLGDTFWPALVALAIDEITEAINADFQPKPSPTQAIHLDFTAEQVADRATAGDLPELVEDLIGGHPVATFEGP